MKPTSFSARETQGETMESSAAKAANRWVCAFIDAFLGWSCSLLRLDGLGLEKLPVRIMSSVTRW
jgi:hypothetical protein